MTTVGDGVRLFEHTLRTDELPKCFIYKHENDAWLCIEQACLDEVRYREYCFRSLMGYEVFSGWGRTEDFLPMNYRAVRVLNKWILAEVLEDAMDLLGLDPKPNMKVAVKSWTIFDFRNLDYKNNGSEKYEEIPQPDRT